MKKFPGFLCIIALFAIIAGTGCFESKKSNSKDITAFTILGVNGTIDDTAKTIALTLPFGTAVNALTPTITITGSNISPASGVSQNFANQVIYTVTAADASTQDYAVMVQASAIGTKTTYTLGGVSFSAIQTTENTLGSGITFPTGTNDSTTATIVTPFVMAETLTTYELWSTVYAWATSHGYTFANPGQMGSDSSGSANNAGGAQQPVTNINWRDAMIWCNALTEYYNANGGTPTIDCVYYTNSMYTTPLRTSTTSSTITYTTVGTQDDPYIKASSNGNVDMSYCTAKGFRLPTSNEYEYAARYLSASTSYAISNATNSALTAGYYWTPGSYASGATADNSDFAATNLVAWFENASGGNTTTTQPVKHKTENALGLYDMSGNIWEFCFDWYTSGSSRVCRGGSFFLNMSWMQVGYLGGNPPYIAGSGAGFRFSRSK